MAVTDLKIAKGANTGKECIRLALGTTANSQTAKATDSITIPFAFQIVRVEVNALTVTSTMTMDVQIGSTSALSAAVTPVAATPTAATLSTTLANVKGAANSIITLKYTSGASGAATNGYASIWIRPRPLNGEV